MFDTNNFNYNVNAVSGTLRKSHPKSKFVVRKLENNMWVFDEETPKIKDRGKEIVVLQVMLIGDNRGLIEYVKKTDFEVGEV